LTLDRSHYRYPPYGNPSAEAAAVTIAQRRTIEWIRFKRPVCFKHIRERCGHAAPTCW